MRLDEPDSTAALRTPEPQRSAPLSRVARGDPPARVTHLVLNRNEYFFPHPAPVQEALAHAATEASRYAPVALHDALVGALAAGLGVGPEQLTLFHGAEDALMKLLSWHRHASRQLIVAELSWLTYLHIAEGLGYQVRQIPCLQSARGFSTPLAPLAELLAGETEPQVVLLASPNNPTGHSLPHEELPPLVRRFPRHAFILDCVYDELDSPLARLAASVSNCYFVGSFSKYFGLPGLRLGYAVGACPKGFKLSLGHSEGTLRGALAALEHRETYARNRAVMRDFARALSEPASGGIVAFESDAPFLLVRVDLPGLGATGFQRAEAESGVTPKYLEHGGARYLRWALGPPQVNERIKVYLSSLQRQAGAAVSESAG